jgi:hypothetical protein
MKLFACQTSCSRTDLDRQAQHQICCSDVQPLSAVPTAVQRQITGVPGRHQYSPETFPLHRKDLYPVFTAAPDVSFLVRSYAVRYAGRYLSKNVSGGQACPVDPVGYNVVSKFFIAEVVRQLRVRYVERFPSGENASPFGEGSFHK